MQSVFISPVWLIYISIPALRVFYSSYLEPQNPAFFAQKIKTDNTRSWIICRWQCTLNCPRFFLLYDALRDVMKRKWGGREYVAGNLILSGLVEPSRSRKNNVWILSCQITLYQMHLFEQIYIILIFRSTGSRCGEKTSKIVMRNIHNFLKSKILSDEVWQTPNALTSFILRTAEFLHQETTPQEYVIVKNRGLIPLLNMTAPFSHLHRSNGQL